MSAARAPVPPKKGGDATDAELVAAVGRGEVGALGALFDRYEPDVRRVLLRLGVPYGDVDDLVQSTFLEVLNAARSYDGRPVARPWLIGLAVIHVRRRRRWVSRAVRRMSELGHEPTGRPATPEETAQTSELASKTRRALEALSEKKRDVVVLVLVEGLSGEEAATLLGIPVATVWTRLHHARAELRSAVLEEKS